MFGLCKAGVTGCAPHYGLVNRNRIWLSIALGMLFLIIGMYFILVGRLLFGVSVSIYFGISLFIDLVSSITGYSLLHDNPGLL